jgi:hypothetical protein
VLVAEFAGKNFGKSFTALFVQITFTLTTALSQISEVVVCSREDHLFELFDFNTAVFASIKVFEGSCGIFKSVFDISLKMVLVEREKVLRRNSSFDFFFFIVGFLLFFSLNFGIGGV